VKKPKRSVRNWFLADLRGNVLEPKRGCFRLVTTIGDEIVKTKTKEPNRRLAALVGDRLMIFGAAVDQIETAQVAAVRVDESGYKTEFIVSRGQGGVNDGTVALLKVKVS
jgi:hypothetical protein